MKMISAAFALCLLAACSQGESDSARHERELAGASDQARAKLGFFWDHFATPQPGEYDFVLKIELPHGDGSLGEEQVWVESIGRLGEALDGVLSVDPQHQPGLVRGDRVAFEDRQIVDWAFFRGDQLIGHYTTRVLLDVMPSDEADIMRALLAENPE